MDFPPPRTAGNHLLLPASAWPRGQGVLLLPTLCRGTRRGRYGSGFLPRVRQASAARHLRRDGGAPGASVRVLRRHPQCPAPVAVHRRACRRGACAVRLQHGPRRLRRAARHGLHAAGASALEVGRGSAGRVDRRHPGAHGSGYRPAACPGRGRHHRRRGRLTGTLRLVRLRMAAPQPRVHGRPLPSAARRPVQPRLPGDRRRGARLAGSDVGRTRSVDGRKLDHARGGDPPGPAGRSGGDRLRRQQWLEARQDHATGAWYAGVEAPHHNVVNGIFKLFVTYERLGWEIPRQRAIVDFVLGGADRERGFGGQGCSVFDPMQVLYVLRAAGATDTAPGTWTPSPPPRSGPSWTTGTRRPAGSGRARGTASTTSASRCTWRRCCSTIPTCASTPSTTGARGRSFCAHPTAAYG